MGTNLFTVEMDFTQLQEVIKSAVNEALEKQMFVSGLPPVLTRQQLMDLLDIGSTKATELLNREDFPVTREFGHPRVPTRLLMMWIEEHTEWINSNAGDNWRVRKVV